MVRLSALGDVIQVLPALDALSQRFPDAQIDAVTESLSAGLLQGHPALRRVITLPRAQMKRNWKDPACRASTWPAVESFIGELRRHRYDLLIDWQSNLRSGLVRMLARAERVLGIRVARLELKPDEFKGFPLDMTQYLRMFATARVPRRGADQPRARARHVARALGWSGEMPWGQLGDVDATVAEPHRQETPSARGPILLHPFVSPFGRFKEWPRKRWSELARSLAVRGQPVWISGGPEDSHAVASIVRDSGYSAAPAPPTCDLRELAANIGNCRAVVAADTGVLHLAAMRGIPTVGLYGPKDPSVHGPWGRWTKVIQPSLPCSPCSQRHCEHSFCMESMSVTTVMNSLLELLETHSQSH